MADVEGIEPGMVVDGPITVAHDAPVKDETGNVIGRIVGGVQTPFGYVITMDIDTPYAEILKAPLKGLSIEPAASPDERSLPTS